MEKGFSRRFIEMYYNFERIVDADIFGLEAPTQITLDE
jgi:hypothetical protein